MAVLAMRSISFRSFHDAMLLSMRVSCDIKVWKLLFVCSGWSVCENATGRDKYVTI